MLPPLGFQNKGYTFHSNFSDLDALAIVSSSKQPLALILDLDDSEQDEDVQGTAMEEIYEDELNDGRTTHIKSVSK